MATEVGAAFVSVVPSMRNFGRTMDSGIGRQVDQSGTRAGRRFGGRFRASMVGALAGAGRAIGVGIGAAVVGTGALFKASITAASDLGETMAATGQIFGKNAQPALMKFAEGAATSLGQSKQSALDAANTFATFGKAAGLQGAGLVGFSTDLTGLASDLASFKNTSPEEAITAIGAALRGESEPIRRYGVLLDDASLRAEALRQGIVTTTKQALTPQQKVLAAQALIFKQTSDAQGDFARTSEGLANQQRILRANWENAKSTLGNGLLPIATRFVTFLNTKMLPVIKGITTAFDKGGLSGGLSKIGGMIAAALPVIRAKIVQLGTMFVNWIRPRIPGMLVALGEFIIRIRNWIAVNAPKIGAKLAAWGRAFITWIGPYIPPLMAKLQVLLNRVGGWINAVGFPWIVQRISKWGTALVGWIEPKIPGILAAFGTLMGRVAAWLLVRGLPMLMLAQAKLGAAFVKAIPQMFQGLSQMGRNIVWGLIKGIASMAPNLTSALVGILPGPLKKFAGKLGLTSPSKVFARFGAGIGEGLVVGIRGTERLIDKTVSGVATKVSSTFGDSLTQPRRPTVGAGIGRMVARPDIRRAGGRGLVLNQTINNPKEERASESVPKAIRRATHSAGWAVA